MELSMLLSYDDFDGDYWEECDGNDGATAGQFSQYNLFTNGEVITTAMIYFGF